MLHYYETDGRSAISKSDKSPLDLEKLKGWIKSEEYLNSELSKTVFGRLFELRAENNFTKRELARRIGCSSTLISTIEQGQPPSLKMLKEFCSVYEVSADYLIGNQQSRYSNQDNVNKLLENVKLLKDQYVDVLVDVSESYLPKGRDHIIGK